MNCERDIRFELLARLCPNSTGADIRSVCTEAGMYAIRARRKTVTEKDFLEAVNKVGGVLAACVEECCTVAFESGGTHAGGSSVAQFSQEHWGTLGPLPLYL
jgi:hypothetical protein